jgi:hypothetical protein
MWTHFGGVHFDHLLLCFGLKQNKVYSS